MTYRHPTASEQDEARHLGHPMPCAVMALPELPEARFVPVEADQNPFENTLVAPCASKASVVAHADCYEVDAVPTKVGEGFGPSTATTFKAFHIGPKAVAQPRQMTASLSLPRLSGSNPSRTTPLRALIRWDYLSARMIRAGKHNNKLRTR